MLNIIINFSFLYFGLHKSYLIFLFFLFFGLFNI